MEKSSLLKKLGIGTMIVLPLVLTPKDSLESSYSHIQEFEAINYHSEPVPTHYPIRKIPEKKNDLSAHINELEKTMKRIEFYNAIIYAESKGNPDAYRKDTKATGLFQLTPIVLEEWNNFNLNEKHSLEDLFEPSINWKIADWYIQQRIIKHYLPTYKLNPHYENILASLNWGHAKLKKIGDAQKNFEKLPGETRHFIKNVLDYLE